MKAILVRLAVLCSFCICPFSGYGSPPPTVVAADSLALVALYNGTAGTNWTNKTNWLTGPTNTWFGVTASGGRVTELNLPSNHLVGPLPNLSALTALQRLDLSFNGLNSPIPSSINSLTSLQHLNLSHNSFSSIITPLPSLTNVKYLALGFNNFTFAPFPVFIFGLTALEYLSLENGRVNSLFPSGISALTQLKELNLSLNTALAFSLPIFNEFGTLSNLESLGLGSINLQPFALTPFTGLSHLHTFDISNCSLLNLPSSGSWASSSLSINISNNQLDFGDLEPLVGISNPTYTNTGQTTLSLGTFVNPSPKLIVGDPFAVNPGYGGSQTQYQWYFNNVQIPGATTGILNLGTSNAGMAGVYKVQMTNSLVPGTLTSANLTLTVIPRVESRFELQQSLIITQDIPASSYGGYWADYDLDGDEDLFVNNSFQPGPNFLYENNGNGTFTKVVSGEIVSIPEGPRYVSWGDYDNDGYPDIFVGEYSTVTADDSVSSLYHNNGNKTFTRMPFNHKADGGLWADYDKDGDLDLSINNTNTLSPTTKLYTNNGNGTFSVINNWIPTSNTFFTGWVDVDNDGDMDYNTTLNFNQPQIFRNTNGVFTQENMPNVANLNLRGATWGDIDGDGDMDMFTVNGTTGAESQFYVNNGSGTFTIASATSRMGVAANAGRGCNFADLDNDGDLDLIVIHRTQVSPLEIRPQLFLNNGTGNFTAVPLTQQSFGFPDATSNMSFADYDNDGWQDVFFGCFDQILPNYLFRNIQGGNGNHWIKLKLASVTSNKSAIGARIDIYHGGARRTRQIMPASALSAQNSSIVHTGLGASTQADSVLVYWPSGFLTKVYNLAGETMHVIQETMDLPPPTVALADSIALVDFFNAMNGANWTTKTNWLINKVNTWYGVVVMANRVTSLSLPNNVVFGAIPETFANLTGLTTLKLSQSNIRLPGNFNALTALEKIDLHQANLNSLPSLAGLTNLDSLNLINNALSFEDLEPIISISGLQYAPQTGLTVAAAANIITGNPWSITSSIGGTANSYQWTKNGVPLGGATTNTFSIASVSAADNGNYQLNVTNSIVTGLTIVPIGGLLTAVTPGAQTLFTWPVNDGIINGNPADSYGGYWVDIDNDGDDDLAVNNLQNGTTGRAVDLYENINGNFTLLSANMPTDDGSRNLTWADYDNDGDLDFYIGDAGFNLLTDTKGAFYRNEGNKTFTRVPLDQPADGGAWADYDNDGKVDLFTMDAGLTNTVYRNMGNGVFALAPVTFASGSDWTLSFADFDSDRDLDLIQVGRRTPNNGFNNIYRNDSAGVYTFLSSNLISTDSLGSARGGSWADIDNDGDMDFFGMNSQTFGPQSAFYFNDGTGNFSKQLASTVLGVDVRGRASSFGDVDNDGDVDLLISNGVAGSTGTNLFLNNANGTFSKVLPAIQSFIPVPSPTLSQVSLGDANSDGFLDIFAATFSAGQPAAVYRNVGNSKKWIKFRLQGDSSNRSGVGARVLITAGGKTQIREVTTQTGLASQNSLVQHFGIDSANQVDLVQVFWPSGIQQILNNVAANQLVHIVEGITPTNTVTTSDSLALVAFYNAMNGPNWTNKSNWLTGKVTTWFGVTVNNQRVSRLQLPTNLVAGTIPPSFATLTGLTVLNLLQNPVRLPDNFNSLTALTTVNLLQTGIASLPSLVGLSNLTSLNVSNNNLTFEDLEPVASIPGIQYSPQNSLPGSAANIVSGNSWTVTPAIGGSGTVYQWFKSGVPVGANSPTFNIPAVAPTDAGSYTVNATNPLVPGLTLTTIVHTLAVISPGAQTMFTWPVNDGLINGTPTDSYGGYWVDIDNDGDDDLAINNLQQGTSGRSADLYENNSGVFTRLLNANMPTDEGARNLTWADYDNDGDLDFYIGDAGFNLFSDTRGAFYRNEGNKTFTRIDLNQSADGGAWADYDNDGNVDLFTMDALGTNTVYRNNGNGNFSLSPVTFASGSDWTLSFADFDSDRDLDLVQVGRRSPDIAFNNLYRNDSTGQYNFLSTNIISTDNLVSARGGSWADIDNDGDMDFFGMNANTSGTTESAFYINDGSGNFSKQTSTAVLGADVRGRASSFGDVDNDGDVDLLVSNGKAGSLGTNLFLNNGNGTFSQVLPAIQSFIPVVPTLPQVSLGDANSDGFLDIFAATFSATQPPAVYRNVGNSNKWIKIRLQGDSSNRSGVGARIRITTGGQSQIREVTTQTGLASQNSLVQHFGIGGASHVDLVEVFWPSGIEQIINSVAANQTLHILEGIAPTNTVTLADSLALVAFYNAMNGANWTNKANWLTGKVSTWYGVTVNNNQRVASLSLPANGLGGTIPDSFTSLTGLTSINLSNGLIIRLPANFNALTNLVTVTLNFSGMAALPSFTGMTQLTSIILTNNNLNFEDLEPVASLPGIQYVPQFALPGSTANIISGNSWTVTPAIGGSATVYQWLKAGIPVGVNSPTFTIAAVSPADAGNYTVSATNPSVPGLTITTANHTLAVISPGAQTLFTWPVNDGLINGTPTDSYGGYWVDIDNDGDDDLAINNLQSMTTGRSVDLYENSGGVFTRLLNANMPTDEGSRNLTWADYDNDGDVDFYIGDAAFNLLSDGRGAFYRNEGNKTFTRIDLNQSADGGAWADFDNDGLVDLFTMDAGLPNTVYRNNGNGSFSLASVTFASGSDWTLSFADIESDRDLDLVQIGKTPNSGFNSLYRNDSTGQYTYLSSNTISTDNLASARGGSWADIDNDGDMDFFGMNSITTGATESAFYLNDGTGNFTKQTSTAVLGADVRGRASSFGDVDNDGDVDLLISNGKAGSLGTNLFLNNGNGTFSQVLPAVQSFIPLASPTLAQVSLGDANTDGFLDIFAATFSLTQPPAVYRNVGNSNKWIKFKLQGDSSNRSGVGARIKIRAGVNKQIREVTSQTGLASQNSLVQHFGIGSASKVDTVTVYWPSGIVQVLTNVSPNQTLTVLEGVTPVNTVLLADSLALVEFYNQMNGPNWTNKTNWLSGPVNTWFGVTTNNYRVSTMSLPNNQVSGTLPASFMTLTGLTSLNFSLSFLGVLPSNFNSLTALTSVNLNSTNLTSLPSLVGLTQLNSFIITNNNLTFEDLEPVVSVPGIQFIPQNQFAPSGSANIVSGNSWSVTGSVGGSANAYQWTKGGAPVGGANSITYAITAVTAPDAGNYQLNVTNSLVPGLTLSGFINTLTVIAPGVQTLFTWPQNDGIINSTPSDSYGGYWVDIDNDGDDDLAISNLQSGLTGRSVDLYENNGGVFTRLLSANMPTDEGTRNLTWADYDNDGDLDFYIGDAGFNLMSDGKGAFYRNEGNKTFTRIPLDQSADGGAWADYDNDGKVDLFTMDAGLPNTVYRNQGNGTFALAPVTFASGSDWTLSFADYDNDRDLDLVQVGRRQPDVGFNNLYRRDSAGVYAYQAGNIISTDNLQSTRGGCWADIDGDRDMDFFAMNTITNGTTQSAFYINNGGGNFTKQTSTTILGVDVRGRACSFGDVNNDGDIDLVVSNGKAGNTGTLLFLNNNGGFAQVLPAQQTFIPVAAATLAQVSLGDANNDGFLDIFAATFNASQPAAVYRNVGNSNNWVKFKLVGVQSNRSAVGARIEIKAGSFWQTREVTTQTGLASQNSLVQHFGLQGVMGIDSVKIYWPSGIQQLLINLPGNQVHTISEVTPPPTVQASNITFTNVLSTQMRVNFTKGNGTGRIVFMKQGSPVDLGPGNGNTYIVNSNFGAGIDYGGGNKVIMMDTASHVDVTGLTPNTTYFVKVFEYNLTHTHTYLFPGAPSASATTLALPNVYVITPMDGATGVAISPAVTAKLVTGAVTYTIQLSLAPNFSSGIIEKSGSRTQVFSSLQYDTMYYTRVKTNLSPDFGLVTTFTTAGPEAFTYVITPANNATGVVLTNLALNVTSSLVTGATTYTIQLSKSSLFDSALMERTGGRTLNFSPLVPGTTYYNRVRTNLTSVWGATRQFTTASAAGLSYVVTPGNNAVNVTYQPTVTANDIGASSYTIELSPMANFSSGIISNTSPTRTMNFTGLLFNTKYYNRVTSNLDSNPGPVRNFTTNSPLTYSYVISPANGATGINYLTNIIAQTVPGASSYTIEANTASDFTGTATVVSGPTRTLAFSLGYNTTYYVRVQTDLLPGQWGATRSFTTKSPLDFSYMITPMDGATNVNFVTNITSNLVPNATTYMIEANTSPTFIGGTSILKMGAARTYSFTLSQATVYYVRVQTNLVPGQWGVTKSFTTGTAQSLAYVISPADAMVNVPTTVNVISNSVPGATTYTIELNTNNTFTGTSTVIGGAGRTKNFAGLSMSTTYFSRVSTNLAPGLWGPTRSFTTVSPGGRVSGVSWNGDEPGEETPWVQEFSVRLFPNPFRDYFQVHVQTEEQLPFAATLSDLNGKTLFQSSDWVSNRIETVSGDFGPGIYLLRIQVGNAVQTLKIMRQ